MQYLELHEKRRHGTDVFPFEYYHVDEHHLRYQMNYHWHAEYELIRVLQGTLRLTLNEKNFVLSARELAFVHGGVLHAGIPENCVYECLVFDLNTFARLTPCAPYIQRVLDRSALIYHHFTAEHGDVTAIAGACFEAMAEKKPGYEMTVIGQLYRFFGVDL